MFGRLSGRSSDRFFCNAGNLTGLIRPLSAVAVSLPVLLLFGGASTAAAQSDSINFPNMADPADWLWIAIPLVIALLIAQFRTARLLRAANENNEEILRNAPDAILMVNAEGSIIRANSAAVDLLGYSREELEKIPIETIIPERFQTKHVEYRNLFLAGRLKASKGGRPLIAVSNQRRQRSRSRSNTESDWYGEIRHCHSHCARCNGTYGDTKPIAEGH